MAAKKASEVIEIAAANLKVVEVEIVGTSPYCQNKFSQKAQNELRAKHEAGGASKSKKAREPKDFQALYEGAIHYSEDGWAGIPAPGIRAAMISACRVAGVVMTRAKLSVFVEADGFDKHDQMPLVKITKGEPEYAEHYVRNETGVVDIRPRPMWREGWRAVIRLRYDADMMGQADVINLLSRAGAQVGIGEGRPDSKKSCGMGWGTFRIVEDGE